MVFSFSEKALSKIKEYDQGHVDRSDQTVEEKANLSAQIESIDFPLVFREFEKAKSANIEDHHFEPPAASDTVKQCTDWESVHKQVLTKITNNKNRNAGIQAIKDGKVAVCILGGGQGSRLGFDGPKGEYDLNLESKDCLFSTFAKRIIRLKNIAGGENVSIPFVVMTSDLNGERIKNWFEQHNYCGLPQKDVLFFAQGILPCLTPEGKLMLQTRGTLATAPDGNGGFFRALNSSGVLQELVNRGVEGLHVASVDNLLCKVGDPCWMGYLLENKCDVGNKVLWKRDANEKVGVVAKSDGKWQIIEYCELDQARLEEVDESGKLKYGAANICNHYFSTAFLQKVAADPMPYHIANKKIPVLDENEPTKTITPEVNNGIKMEHFIFDCFPRAENLSLWEVSREDEFGPVKNAPGGKSDTPEIAVKMLSDRNKRWLEAAGAKVVNDGVIEIDPLLSYAGEGLEKFKGQTVTAPCFLTV